MCNLPTIEAQDRLAHLLNSYIAFLQQVAEPVAPRLTLRMAGFAMALPAYQTAAAVFCHAHTTAAAFVALHAAYTGAIAILEGGGEPEAVRARLAPLFARPDTLHECIGAARPDDLHNPTDLLALAKQQARAAGLTKFRGGLVYKPLAPEVVSKVNKLLTEAAHLVELYNTADGPEQFSRLLAGLQRAVNVR